jgi:hypothetical protein
MDDIYLFDNDEQTLWHDFQRIQQLLGIRALNVNPTKTVLDGADKSVYQAVSAIQEELAAIIENHETPSVYVGSGAEGSPPDEPDDFPTLDAVQVEHLLELLVDPKAAETDVEMILGILHEHTDSITAHIPSLLARFPNIVKQIHRLTASILDKDALTDQIIDLLDSGHPLIEYQLFWIAVIAEDHLIETKNFGKLILKLFEKTADH